MTEKAFHGGRTPRATDACEPVRSWDGGGVPGLPVRRLHRRLRRRPAAMVAHNVAGYRFVMESP
jgi:hypothetical protein